MTKGVRWTRFLDHWLVVSQDKLKIARIKAQQGKIQWLLLPFVVVALLFMGIFLHPATMTLCFSLSAMVVVFSVLNMLSIWPILRQVMEWQFGDKKVREIVFCVKHWACCRRRLIEPGSSVQLWVRICEGYEIENEMPKTKCTCSNTRARLLTVHLKLLAVSVRARKTWLRWDYQFSSCISKDETCVAVAA